MVAKAAGLKVLVLVLVSSPLVVAAIGYRATCLDSLQRQRERVGLPTPKGQTERRRLYYEFNFSPDDEAPALAPVTVVRR